MKIRSVLAATVAMLAASLYLAPASSAATTGAEGATGSYGCSGSLIDSRNVTTGSGTVLGKLYVYYSSANNGTNCAVTVDTYYGQNTKKLMTAVIERCADSACSYIDYQDSEHDYFYSYAGPVTITNTNGHCIKAIGHIEKASSPYTQGSARLGPSHCG